MELPFERCPCCNELNAGLGIREGFADGQENTLHRGHYASGGGWGVSWCGRPMVLYATMMGVIPLCRDGCYSAEELRPVVPA